MGKIISLLRGRWLNYIGLCLFFLYVFLFSSLNGVSPFNHVANGCLILLFCCSFLSVLLKKEWKKTENRVFFLIWFLLLFFFSLSDACNRSLSASSFALLIALFSSYMLVKTSDFSLSTVLFAYLLAIALGLSVVVVINLKTIISIKAMYSMPFLNLDAFAAMARNGFCSGLVLIFGFRKTKHNPIMKISIICFSAICMFYLFFSTRIGSLAIAVLFLLALLFYYFWTKKKYLAILIAAFAFLFGFLSLVFLPIESSLLDRVRLSILQIFSPDFIYEASVRKRLMMILRDLPLSLRFPFFGLGSEYPGAINSTIGHNAFGTIALSYGWFSLCLFSALWILPSVHFLKKKEISTSTLYLLYFALIQAMDLVYGFGTISRHNYLIVGLMFALYVKDKKKMKHSIRGSFFVNI